MNIQPLPLQHHSRTLSGTRRDAVRGLWRVCIAAIAVSMLCYAGMSAAQIAQPKAQTQTQTFSTLQAQQIAKGAPSFALVLLKPDQAQATGVWLTPSGQATEHSALTSQMVELASVYKLLTHVYASARRLPMPDYACTGRASVAQQEQYCCTQANESVDASLALARSCGAFFEPSRLGVKLQDWQAYWRSTVPQAPAWLVQDITHEKTLVRVDELLYVLQSIPASQRLAAQEALLQVVVQGRAQGAARYMGGRWRVKTFTWQNANRSYTGGGAGWLLDGTAVWFAHTGGSSQVIQQWAKALDHALPMQSVSRKTLEQASSDCVRVHYFARYPLRAVKHAKTGKDAPLNTALSGLWVAHFERGTQLQFIADGQQRLTKETDGSLQLHGQHALEDYVARVVQREGQPQHVQASRALAILARTYLVQNAQRDDACYELADSSATQRVSAGVPIEQAQQAALWSAGLTLGDLHAQYRSFKTSTADGAKPFLAWETAVADEQAGRSSLEILQRVWPQFELTTLNGHTECVRQPKAEQWLQQNITRWSPKLIRLTGYEANPNVAVCTLKHGQPYADLVRNRIYVRGSSNFAASTNDRIAIAHEYLHIAFKHHPSHSDEDFIESTARSLILGPNS